MNSFSKNNYADIFTGVNVEVPVLGGSHKRYINFDNAASTPTLKAVQQAINDFMDYYSSVHRGTGFKSQLSTHFYEAARQSVLHFVGADPQVHTCIFGKNATEAINKLAHRFPFTSERDIVLTSGMEHHSNDLPWRAVANTIHAKLTATGRLDEPDFEAKLESYADRIALVAITGASNVTGFLNPIHRLAEKAHTIGAQILVDCAQLAPHRRVDMRPTEDPAHLDYVALSAHKIYAPFGTGALIGRKEAFEHGDPDLTGGGTVEIVTLDDVVWAEPPEREEAGSPNTVGAIALGAAIHQMESIGMEEVARHETDLTAYALNRLQKVPNLEIYGDKEPQSAGDRLGVMPMQLNNHSHFLTAAILGYEFGIGVRSGCFCAHPYILHLLHLTDEQAQSVRNRMINGDKSDMPGLVRASFGLYNTREEVDMFVEALNRIAYGEYKGKYVQDTASGEYYPENWAPDFERYFSFAGRP
jgi:cysteine desulfurase/selenocysteine lyase